MAGPGSLVTELTRTDVADMPDHVAQIPPPVDTRSSRYQPGNRKALKRNQCSDWCAVPSLGGALCFLEDACSSTASRQNASGGRLQDRSRPYTIIDTTGRQGAENSRTIVAGVCRFFLERNRGTNLLQFMKLCTRKGSKTVGNSCTSAKVVCAENDSEVVFRKQFRSRFFFLQSCCQYRVYENSTAAMPVARIIKINQWHDQG